MIQTDATARSSPRFRMLTDDQVDGLTTAAMEIFEKVGYKLLYTEARKMNAKKSFEMCSNINNR